MNEEPVHRCAAMHAALPLAALAPPRFDRVAVGRRLRANVGVMSRGEDEQEMDDDD